MKISRNSFGEHFFEEVNGGQFIDAPSTEVFERRIAQEIQVEPMLYIVMGTDSGLLANFIETQMREADQRVFILVELPELLPFFSEVIFPDTIHLVSSWDQVSELMKTRYRQMVVESGAHLILSVAAKEGDNHFYQPLVESFYQRLPQLIFAFSQQNYSQISLANYQQNLIPIRQFKKFFKQKQAVIAAAGPGLQSAITWIKQHQSHVAVFAVGRVAANLAAQGIHVDFVVSIDPTEASYLNSAAFLSLSDTSVLLHSHHISPALLKRWGGKHLYFGKKQPWCEKEQLENSMTGGNSVGHAAVSQAIYLGFETLYLAGLDFCFRENGETHFVEVQSQSRAYLEKELVAIQNVCGQTVMTSRNLAEGRDFLEKLIKMQTQLVPFLNVWQLSPDAARIKQVEILPLDQSLSSMALFSRREFDLLLAEKWSLSTQLLKEAKQELFDVLCKIDAVIDFLQFVLQNIASEEPLDSQSKKDGAEYFNHLMQQLGCMKEWIETMGFEFFLAPLPSMETSNLFYQVLFKRYLAACVFVRGMLA